MEFSIMVKKIRKGLGLSMGQLLRDSNIRFSIINFCENGKSNLSKTAKGLFYGFLCKQKYKLGII